MGHDIFAQRNEQDEIELAYLRKGAWNPTVRNIYNALNVQEFDGGVSGFGNGKYFTHSDISDAVKKIPLNDEATIKFLEEILKKLKPDEKVYIRFC